MIFLTFWGVISIIWGFSKVKVQILKMFLGLLNFKFFLGMPESPYIFGIKSRCWVQAFVFRNKKCHNHLTNAPKELVKHKTHLRKVSCYYRRYAPDTINLEMRPEVNVKVKVTQNGTHHFTIPRGINTPNLGFLHQII